MAPSGPAPARPRNILVVHPHLPTHDRDSGSRRLRWIVELLVGEGHQVTFLGHAGWSQGEYAAQLRDLGVEVHTHNGQWWRTAGRSPQIPGPGIDLAGLARRGRFDLAWVSTFEMGEIYIPLLRRESPATRIALDTVDVHHVRLLRGAELSGEASDLERAERTRLREQAVYSTVDRLVAVSDPDADALRALCPEVPVSIVSNVHAIPEPGPGFAQRNGLVFVGSFDHKPNVGAITGFAQDVWPRVRAAVPEATLAVVGTNPPPAVQALAGDGIVVTGWVPETRPYLDAARVSIAPLRYGAGVKGKIGEAMSLGVPVVTTTIGAEGMGLVDGEHALIADDDAALAEAIVRAHTDAELWARLSAAGPVHIEATLGTGAARRALGAIVGGSLPRPFVATDAWSSPDALPALLATYLDAFSAADDVSLVLPTTDDAEVAIGRALKALTALGADPAAIPDVAILHAAEGVPAPSAGVRVGAAATAREEGVVTLDVDAPAEAWRAAAAAGPAPRRGGPVASIVICLHGKREYTERCLASLESALGSRLGTEIELVLVDNASPDDTAELLDAWEGRATVLRLPENRNFAGGNNAGAAVARGRVLIFLNNDTEVPAGVVEGLVDEALRPSVGAVGLRMLYPDGRLQHGGYLWRATVQSHQPGHMFHGEDGELPAARTAFDTSGITGACVALRAELFDAVGGFDDNYVNGWEDADLCQRVRATGARIRYRGDLAIVHHEGVTSGANYAAEGNERRFREAWGPALHADDELLMRQLGAALGVFAFERRNGVAQDGAEAAVVGPVHGIGPLGDEARSLLLTLRGVGDVAARTPSPGWIRPAVDEATRELLVAAHARPAQPGATTIVVRDGSLASPEDPIGGGPVDPAIVAGATAPDVVRLADLPDVVDPSATAWAATPALAECLVEAGWPRERVRVVPPQRVVAEPGPGGGGLLALLPDHEPAARDAVLDALVATGLTDAVALLPTARTSELAAHVASRLPDARLLTPVTDERAFGVLAARADVVLAVDPADRFDRRALLAASTGAAVVVRPDGPAAELLGDLAIVADPSDPVAVSAALARVDRSAQARDRRIAAVRAACGSDAARLAYRAAVAKDAGAPADHHAAGIEAFGRGDAAAALAELELALAAGFDADVASDLAVVCHALGDAERAAALLEECLVRQPDHVGARENLALLAA